MKISLIDRIRETFLECTSSDQERLNFSADKFFSLWFRRNGTAYYFLFSRNLSRTNIQFAELMSLIRLHARSTETHNVKRVLHSLTVVDFLKGLQRVVNDLILAKPSKVELCDTLIDLYGEIFGHLILLDVLHGSCSVFFPAHLELDLFSVCGESGYIHSCGKSIYARELGEADDEDFKKHVVDYLKNLPGDQKTFFAVYAHEDFTPFDRDQASNLRGGLDDVKIYAEKYYLGTKPLIQVLQELRSLLPHKIELAPAGSFRRHKKIRSVNNVRPDRTVWLMIDHAVTQHNSAAKESPFLVCYDQLYKNENPFHVFDENKPAWVAHTTIPHDLAGAMLNLSRPEWPAGEVNIYDPFSGSGTTALEALKFPKVRIQCNDKSPIGRLLLEDNFAFFGKTKEDLSEIHKQLLALSNPSNKEYLISFRESAGLTPLKEAVELLQETSKTTTDDDWFDIPKTVAEKLQKSSFSLRLRFYLALRTKLRHAVAFQREPKGWNLACAQEARSLAFQVKELIRLRKKIQKNGGQTESLCSTSSEYSAGVTIRTELFEPTAQKRLVITEMDAIEPTDRLFDVIITDPPYGFNNKKNTLELARTLTKALDQMVASLKPQGQLLIALPDISSSGRRIPLFATRMWITEQVIAQARGRGFEASTPVNISPRLGNLFHAPYYWRSEKTLTRAILHFRFIKKGDSSASPREHLGHKHSQKIIEARDSRPRSGDNVPSMAQP